MGGQSFDSGMNETLYVIFTPGEKDLIDKLTAVFG